MSSKLGNIQLILGCMFSGKTSELIRRIQRYKSIQKKVLLEIIFYYLHQVLIILKHFGLN